jgi:hypothetical protein
MKSTLLALATLAFSFNVMATTSSQSTDQFCADRADPNYLKELIEHPANLLPFRNQGGIANGGVCWWHSRFQRNALYLTYYQPAEKAPNGKEAAKIISQIRAGDSVVRIPGFRNFSEFASAYADQVLRELEKWQKNDGILKFNWVNGLAGKTIAGSDNLKDKMDELYQYVEVEGNIAYTKLQIKGIDSHAWLIVHVEKTEVGYDLEVLDSNFPEGTYTYRYITGEKSFFKDVYGQFTPYLERKNELNDLKMGIMKQCEPEKYKAIKEQEEAERRERSEQGHG